MNVGSYRMESARIRITTDEKKKVVECEVGLRENWN
jgi:hypothetical protein